MTNNDIFQLIQDVFNGLEDGGVIETHVEITNSTVLIGAGTVLDSIQFVTLFTDLEDRLSEITGEEIYLLIDEIHAFNPENTFLTVEVLISYIANLLRNMKDQVDIDMFQSEILLANLEAEIIKSNPLQRKKVDFFFKNMNTQMRGLLSTYLMYCVSQGDTIEYLAQSYTLLVKETLKEQIFFAKHGHYRYKSYEEVKDKVYNNPKYMKMYMTGLCISMALWDNHAKMFDFFIDTISKANSGYGGKYLEIGPGHGFFLMQAMEKTKYQKYEAVDISETSVYMTKKILECYQTEANYDVKCLDFLQMKTQDKYDAIVMGEVLEHVEKPNVFLDKISSIANNDTYIYISTCVNAPEIDHIYLFSTLAEVEELFNNAGLTIQERLVLPYQNETVETSNIKKLPINLAYSLRKC